MFVTLTLNPAVDQTIAVREELSVGRIHSVAAETFTPGGKGVNVAKMIAACGRPVIAAGLLGHDRLAFYEATLGPAGIACRFLALPDDTRVNLMIADGGGREMKFNRPGFPDVAFDEPALVNHVARLASPGTVVIMSGSLPVRFPDDTYARLLRTLRGTGCPTVVDTSGPPLAAALQERPTVIKPNREELEGLLGRSLESGAAMLSALRVLRRAHEAVIVSDGPRGAWFAAGEAFWLAAPPPVACLDTTGAGDALLGQFCAGYFPARVLTADLMARAVAAGAAAVEQRGTPMLSRQRIEALAAQAVISRQTV